MEESNNWERLDGEEVLRSYQRRTQKARQRKPGGIPPQFPKLLHAMLCRADDDGFSHIVSWRPHGKSFTVYDREKFVKDVMPQYFQQTKFTSFQRQLNLYGFRRINETGPDYNGYYHEKFVRDRPDLVDSIARVVSKASPPSSLASSPKPAAGFYEGSTSSSSGPQPFLPISSGQPNMYPSIPTHNIAQPGNPLTLAAIPSNMFLPSMLPFAPGNPLQTATIPFQTTQQQQPQHYPFNNRSHYSASNYPPSYNNAMTSHFINNDPSVQWSGRMHQRQLHGSFMERGQLFDQQQQQNHQQTFTAQQSHFQQQQQQPQELLVSTAGVVGASNNSDLADVDELVRSTEQLLESLPLTTTTQNRAGLMTQRSELLPEGVGSSSTLGSALRTLTAEDFAKSEGDDFNESTTDMKLFGLCDDSVQHGVEGGHGD